MGRVRLGMVLPFTSTECEYGIRSGIGIKVLFVLCFE
jgi:hypothetical protein